jgi:hypothetical protein
MRTGRARVLVAVYEYLPFTFPSISPCAAGLRQPITLIYTPPDLERRTAQIRITAEVGPPDVISIIADPSASTSSWMPCLPGGARGRVPPRVDFGRIPLLHRAERPLTIFNEGVIPVDFHVTFLKPHAEFDFTPTAGTVVPGEAVTFTLSYAPLTQTTGVCEVLIATSVTDLPPAKIVLTGSSVPGAVREHAEQEAQRRAATSGGGSTHHGADASSEGNVDNQGGSGSSGGEDAADLHLGTRAEAPPALDLRPGRGARFARTDPGQLVLEERLAAYKSAQVCFGAPLCGSATVRIWVCAD